MQHSILLWSLKAGVVLSLLFLAYSLLFKNNTEFKLKRGLLMVLLFAAISFPLISIQISNPLAPQVFPLKQMEMLVNTIGQTPERTAENTQFQMIAIQPNLSVLEIIWLIYLIGAIVSGLILMIELTKLFYWVRNGERQTQIDHNVIKHKHLKQPFSFWKWIFLPVHSNYDEKDLQIILTHENLHIQQRHTIDIILTSVAQIVLWYHPAIYLLQKSIKSNHEALADEAVLKATAFSHYSQTLLAISLQTNSSVIRHYFSLVSSLSKRLKLMKIKKTSKTRTFQSIVMLTLFSAVIATQTVVNGQESNKNSKSNYDNEYAVTTHVPIEIQSEDPILNRGGYTTINGLLFEEFAPILGKIKQTHYSEINNDKLGFSVEITQDRKNFYDGLVRYDQSFNMTKTEFIKDLTEAELESIYSRLTAWYNTRPVQLREYIRLIDKKEFLKLKYVIIKSRILSDTSQPFLTDNRIFEKSEVDQEALPVGGMSIFVNNVALNLMLDEAISLNVLPDNIEFQFVVGSKGIVTQVNLISKIKGDEDHMDKVYKMLGQLNRNILKYSMDYGWKPAIKDNEQVSSFVKIQIPKSLL
jgi:beta-lactamase regulating signal transducer with metallopeptidase domain